MFFRVLVVGCVAVCVASLRHWRRGRSGFRYAQLLVDGACLKLYQADDDWLGLIPSSTRFAIASRTFKTVLASL